jgi:hypothetical protein
METMARLDPGLLDALARQSREEPLAALNGLVRFDVVDGESVERWYLDCRKGIVTVALEGGKPDCVMTGDRATFEAVLSGTTNPMPALLRGRLTIEGDFFLLLGMRRLFPHQDVIPDQPAAGYAERRS